MCLIWRFMVMVKRMMKYTTRMGQNTGTSKAEKNVAHSESSAAFMELTLFSGWWPGSSGEC